MITSARASTYCALGLFLLAAVPTQSVWASSSDERLERLPEKDRKWLEEEVPYIITGVERDVFLDLETRQERDAFMDAFWRKRDSNPATPENEYRDEHYRRLAYVNEFFGRDTFRKGWQTDRGRFHIVLGPPPEKQYFDAYDEVYPAELWFYNNPEFKQLGLPPFFYLLFFRRQGMGELELYRPGVDGPDKLLTGYQTISSDFRNDTEKAYNVLFRISPELAHASLSFRTDEGDIAQFQAPSFGTLALLDRIAAAPFRGLDTSYAEYRGAHEGWVESDYLFSFVPSWSAIHVLPGPGKSYYLHWVIEIDPQHIALVKDEEQGVYSTTFIVSGELLARHDPEQKLVEFRKESFVTFNEAQGEIGRRLPFAYSGMIPVVPGAFDVRMTLRNRVCPDRGESGCRKSYTLLEASIDVPKWDTGGSRLGEVVLAYRAERGGGDPVYRPYRFGSVELLVNPRSTCAIGESLVAMVEVLDSRHGERLKFRVLSRGDPGQVRLEKLVSVEPFRLEPLVQEISLEGFTGDHYTLVVDLLDSEGTVLDTQASEFDVSPLTAIPRPSVRVSWPMILPESPGQLEMTLGRQHLNLGEKGKARELFESAFTASPQMGAARESLASLLLEDDDVDRVIELLEPVYKKIPDRYEVLVLLGEAYFKQKNYRKASELFEKASTIRRLDTRLLNVLALSEYELGNSKRARELLEQSLALLPDQPQVKELLKKLKSEGADPGQGGRLDLRPVTIAGDGKSQRVPLLYFIPRHSGSDQRLINEDSL
jgi:GWxTD domain-containing protein